MADIKIYVCRGKQLRPNRLPGLRGKGCCLRDGKPDMAFFEGCDNLYRWWEHMSCRPGFAATTPENLRQGEQRAAS